MDAGKSLVSVFWSYKGGFLMIKILFVVFILLVGLLMCMSNQLHAAVILQYHHVDSKTPRSTSLNVNEFSTHLNWLEENDFKVIALSSLIQSIKAGALDENEKIAVITFDDNGESICSKAWPLLQQKNFPATIFINTVLMEKPNSSQCSWSQLSEMVSTGLISIGNHSYSHPHMVTPNKSKSFTQWQFDMRFEITKAERTIRQNLGHQEKLFAYPYGEYNRALKKIVEELGYSAVGQQSGAVGNSTDLLALPRFPLSGDYAELSALADKLLSLPFPISNTEVSVNPFYAQGFYFGNDRNTPILELHFSSKAPMNIRCYLGKGEVVQVFQTESELLAQYQGSLKAGRHRYNCTAASETPKRYFWFSQQWLLL